MANGEMTGWIANPKSVAEFVTKIGLWPLLAIGLIYVMLMQHQKMDEQQQQEMTKIREAVETHSAAMQTIQQYWRDSTYQNTVTNDLLRRVCINGARSTDDRNDCWRTSIAHPN